MLIFKTMVWYGYMDETAPQTQKNETPLDAPTETSFEEAANQAVAMTQDNHKAAFDRSLQDASQRLVEGLEGANTVKDTAKKLAVGAGVAAAITIGGGNVVGNAVDAHLDHLEEEFEQHQQLVEDGERAAFDQGMLDGRVAIAVPPEAQAADTAQSSEPTPEPEPNKVTYPTSNDGSEPLPAPDSHTSTTLPSPTTR